jgi:hypothetical protein
VNTELRTQFPLALTNVGYSTINKYVADAQAAGLLKMSTKEFGAFYVTILDNAV